MFNSIIFPLLVIMKVAVILLGFVACALAAEVAEVKLEQAPGPDQYQTNRVNGLRQHEVNKKALYFGAGVGTAPYYGVPGTDVKGYGYRPYGYGGK